VKPTPIWKAEQPNSIEQAANLLRSGEVVAFPTETVYGLGADARLDTAVAKIFEAKGRPSDNPLIVHIADQTELVGFVQGQPNEMEQALMNAFWPGPFSLVLPVQTAVLSPRVTAGLATVAVRVPDHPIALALIKQSGCPLAAPSANRSGRPSPTTASHVHDDLNGRIAGVLDGGATGVGVESTVVQVTVEGLPNGSDHYTVHVLRPGGITAEQIRKVVPSDVAVVVAKGEVEDAVTPTAPGMKYAHYAPKGDLALVRGESAAQVAQWIQQYVEQAYVTSRANALDKPIQFGVLTYDDHLDLYQGWLEQTDVPLSIVTCGTYTEPLSVAKHLYAALRQFDALGTTHIFAEAYPESDLGLAVMNRLMKAANHQIIAL
jgi:L-threonylcarbamoyladenylate synthase